MITQLFQPPRHILVCLVLGDVVDEQGSDSTTVVGRSDSAIPLLPSSVPDLRLDRLSVDLDAASSEFDTDGRFGVQVELIASEPRKKVGLSDTRVANQNHFESAVSSVLRPGLRNEGSTYL